MHLSTSMPLDEGSVEDPQHDFLVSPWSNVSNEFLGGYSLGSAYAQGDGPVDTRPGVAWLIRDVNGSGMTVTGLPSELGANGNISGPINLTALLGPKRQELYKIVPITIIYCVIFVFGIIGNVSTCIVIARNRFMQTATNFYLFNLAISDLLVLILGLPQETYIYWSAYPYVFGEVFCILRVMAAETSTNASILTMTAFTMERYVAICHPMRSQTMSNLRRATKVIIIIWFVSAVCSIPMTVQFGIVYLHDAQGLVIPQSATCTIRGERFLKHAFEVSTFLFFFAPMTIITVLYAMIGLAIRRSALRRTGSDTSNHSEQTGGDLRAQQQASARRAVLKMLVAVVAAFFICWAPFHVQRLLVVYLNKEAWTPEFTIFQNVLYQISGILYYVISVVNPVLYNVMSLKFRKAFRNTIFRPCRPRTQKRPPAVLRTYRFHPRPFLTDTHLTLLHLNGNAGKCRVVQRPHSDPNNKYLPGRSQSSSVGSNHSPRGHLIPPSNDSAEGIEMDQIMTELKSNHSYHHNPRNMPPIHQSSRPYHSYA